MNNRLLIAAFVSICFCPVLAKYHPVREVGMTSLLWILLSKDG